MRTIKVRDLKPRDVVVNLDTGATKTVIRYPQPCKERGYVYVVTDGEPVNTHGDNPITVK